MERIYVALAGFDLSFDEKEVNPGVFHSALEVSSDKPQGLIHALNGLNKMKWGFPRVWQSRAFPVKISYTEVKAKGEQPRPGEDWGECSSGEPGTRVLVKPLKGDELHR